MASISNFLKNNILSTSKLINAKVSGALTSVNGTIGIVDSIFQKLFGNLLTGDSPLTDLTLSYEEQTIVNKDRAVTSTAVDPVKVPITSSVASATLAETIIQNPSAVVSISGTQATDIVTEPTGIEPLTLFRHFIQPRPAVLMDLTTIDYKLDVLMCLQTAQVQQPAVKYECCSRMDIPTQEQGLIPILHRVMQ